jgi:hypothetical protein
MPAESKKMRRMMAIAEHHPEKLYKRNRAVLQMSHQQLHDFASTSEKNLPMKKKKHPLHDYRRGNGVN